MSLVGLHPSFSYTWTFYKTHPFASSTKLSSGVINAGEQNHQATLILTKPLQISNNFRVIARSTVDRGEYRIVHWLWFNTSFTRIQPKFDVFQSFFCFWFKNHTFLEAGFALVISTKNMTLSLLGYKKSSQFPLKFGVDIKDR